MINYTIFGENSTTKEILNKKQKAIVNVVSYATIGNQDNLKQAIIKGFKIGISIRRIQRNFNTNICLLRFS